MLGFGLFTTASAKTETIDMSPQACLMDLEYTAALILHNDAGVMAKKWHEYPEHLQKVYHEQKTKVADVKKVADCEKLIQTWLSTIRKGHLGVVVHENAKVKQQMPSDELAQTNNTETAPTEQISTQKLSNSTTLLTILSFDYTLYEKLQQVVTTNQDNLLNAPYLVIDLRKNGGGSDQTAQVLYKILGEASYWTRFPQVYASAANIEGWEGYKKMITDENSQQHLSKIIQKMRAQPQQWIHLSDMLESEEVITATDVLATPQKVVILIDQNCGSSCEQFTLTAQQNPRVVTMGRATYGALDASNLMEKLTPSGQLEVYYASTYIQRPAGKEIDNIGIQPMIKLAKPNNAAEYDAEIKLAQQYLEHVSHGPSKN